MLVNLRANLERESNVAQRQCTIPSHLDCIYVQAMGDASGVSREFRILRYLRVWGHSGIRLSQPVY